jgi:general stress protein CsbA
MLKMILTFMFFVLLFSSCYYGVMQGAHTLGKDHITMTGGVTLHAYFSAESKREAEDSRVDYLETYPTADFAIGATERIT